MTQTLARMGLARTYEQEQDYVQAYKWFDIVAAHKLSFGIPDNGCRDDPSPGGLACVAALDRDALAAKMTQAQINEAQRLARAETEANLARSASPRVETTTPTVAPPSAGLPAVAEPAMSVEAAEAAYRRGDYATALELFRPLADHGDANAQNALGVMYITGQGVSQNYVEAMKWYRKAADQGFAIAQTNLGAMYYLGQSVPQNYADAMRWYRKAADQGNADAQNTVGGMYESGHGVPQDYAEAAKWYRKAADQGNDVAQHNLGVLYRDGHGVAQNYAEAAEWFHKAADQGNAKAQHDLGALYYRGQGVEMNYAEALNWFRKVAEQGNAEDQNIVGAMYENGQGVTQDRAEAAKWFRMAAEQGNQEARSNLAALYARFPELAPFADSFASRVDKLSAPPGAKNVMDLFNVALSKVDSENSAYCLKSARLACSMHMQATLTCPQIIPDLYKVFTTLDALENQGMTPNQAAKQMQNVLAGLAVQVPRENRIPFAWRLFMNCLETADQ